MRNMAFSSLATSLTMSFCNEMTGRFESYMGGTRWEGHPLPTAGCPTYFQTVQSPYHLGEKDTIAMTSLYPLMHLFNVLKQMCFIIS